MHPHPTLFLGSLLSEIYYEFLISTHIRLILCDYAFFSLTYPIVCTEFKTVKTKKNQNRGLKLLVGIEKCIFYTFISGKLRLPMVTKLVIWLSNTGESTDQSHLI